MSNLQFTGTSCRGWALPGPTTPTIISLSSYFSPAGATILVSINGTNFKPYSVVKFATFYPTTYFINSQQVEFYVPTSIISGTYPVQVFNDGVGSNVVNYTLDSNYGPTGPTGPASTVVGPTGPTGPASTVVGPTGPTGPSFAVTIQDITLTPAANIPSANYATLVNNYNVPSGTWLMTGLISAVSDNSAIVIQMVEILIKNSGIDIYNFTNNGPNPLPFSAPIGGIFVSDGTKTLTLNVLCFIADGTTWSTTSIGGSSSFTLIKIA